MEELIKKLVRATSHHKIELHRSHITKLKVHFINQPTADIVPNRLTSVEYYAILPAEPHTLAALVVTIAGRIVNKKLFSW